MRNVGNSSRGRNQGVPKIFRATMYMAHCGVIFAIAQLSCFNNASPLYSEMNCTGSRSKIYHIPLKLLLHCLVKVEYSTVHLLFTCSLKMEHS